MKGWKFYYKRAGHFVEDGFRKYRSYLMPKCYRQYLSVPLVTELESSVVSVIDVKTTEVLTDSGRYFQGMVRGLVDSGHIVYVVRKLWVVGALYKKRYCRPMIEAGKIQFIDRRDLIANSDEVDYFWCDREGELCRTEGFKLAIQLSMSSRPLAGRRWMPYQVHPDISDVPRLSVIDIAKMRRFGVFFVGNVTSSYDSDFVKSHDVMTRIQALDVLMDSDLNLVSYENFDGVGEVLEEDRERVFVPRYDREARRSGGLIPFEKYLGLLGEMDFIVCTPGTFMPFAHNVIEGMSQGCVPILEYSDYFMPELEDGVNCLAFHDDESLVGAIARAVRMTEEERQVMREEVCRYYEDYLMFPAFVGSLEGEKELVRAFYYA
ncbi:MAG: hypothetical protein ACSHX6_07975 [Akkermansiaceae bacterium]